MPSAAAWARAVPAIAALRPFFTAPSAVILPGVVHEPRPRHRAAPGHAERQGELLQRPPRLQDDAELVRLLPRVPRPGHQRRAAGCHRAAPGLHGEPDERGLQPAGPARRRPHQRVQVRLQRRAEHLRRRGARPASAGILVSLAERWPTAASPDSRAARVSPSRVSWFASTAPATASARPTIPYSLTFADSLSRVTGNHFLKFGGDVRLIRMTTDQLGGITYTYSNLAAFLANTVQQVQFSGDLSEPSPFHNGASGDKHIKQEYYVGFAQDEWRVRAQLHAELRPPLRLLRAAAGGRQPDRQVQHRHRRARSGHDAVLHLEEDQLPASPRRILLAEQEDGDSRRRRHLRRTRADRRPDSADRGRTLSSRPSAAVR